MTHPAIIALHAMSEAIRLVAQLLRSIEAAALTGDAMTEGEPAVALARAANSLRVIEHDLLRAKAAVEWRIAKAAAEHAP